jgi:hypothetical protein
MKACSGLDDGEQYHSCQPAAKLVLKPRRDIEIPPGVFFNSANGYAIREKLRILLMITIN